MQCVMVIKLGVDGYQQKPYNTLKLQADMFGLKSFAEHKKGRQIQLQLDNATAVAYINNIGGSHSQELDCIAQELWEWSIHREIGLSTVHIPGMSNADVSLNLNDRRMGSEQRSIQ